MEFLIVYLAAMIVPGALLSRVLGLGFQRPGFDIALSFSVVVLALALGRGAGLDALGFSYLLLSCYAAIVGLWFRKVYRASGRGHAALGFDRVYLIPFMVMLCIAGYTLWAGPYTEVPSDAWWHLGRIHDRLAKFHEGSVGSLQDIENLAAKSSGYWYTTAAYFLGITNTGLERGLKYLAFANTLLFSGGVYSFALFVFRGIGATRIVRHAAAAGSVFFFFTHFGLSVFSYVRYYVYAPTMLNYVVYLSALACVLRFLKAKDLEYRLVVIAVVLGAVSAMVHTQEAMFIVVMSVAVLLVELVRAWSPSTHRVGGWNERASGRRISVLFMGLGLAYGVLHVSAYVMLVRHNPLNHGLMAEIGNYLPFLRNLYILKPTYQFYQVLTVWGVLVYVMFVLCARELKQSTYLMAGMLLPVLTVFNPVFCDLFLRFSYPEVLWRVCYALPLPFVGGYLLVNEMRTGFRGPNPLRRTAAFAVAAALLVLLLPVRTTYFVSPYSKIYTLAPVGPGNDHRIWSDLLEFLDAQEGRNVVTDPVTGYVINGLTDKNYRGYKFYGYGALPVNSDSYRAADFNGRSGWLVVVNMRDGADSETGRYGRHWRQGIMKVSNFYSKAFLDFLRDNPRLFHAVWNHAGISVYKVKDAQAARRPELDNMSEQREVRWQHT